MIKVKRKSSKLNRDFLKIDKQFALVMNYDGIHS